MGNGSKQVRVPKYMVTKLLTAASYARKCAACIEQFEIWVRECMSDDFPIDSLRALNSVIDRDGAHISTEALTEVGYGNAYGTDIDKLVSEIEAVLNAFKEAQF